MFELLFICLLDRIFSIPRVAVTGLSPDKSTLKKLLVSYVSLVSYSDTNDSEITTGW